MAATSQGGRRVAVVGVGYSTIGRRSGLTSQQLSAQSVTAALDDAGLRPRDIDGVAMHTFPHQFIAAYQVAGMLGVPTLSWLSGSVEGPSFMTAAMHATAAVASGTCETAVAIRTILQAGASGPGGGAPGVPGEPQFTAPYGAGQPAQWAGMFMQRMMHEFGWTEAMFGAQMVAQREFAALNPSAFFREPLTIEDYLAARYISKPCRLLDCDYPVDASGAVIFTTAERARDLKQKPVFVESWSFGTTQQTGFELMDMTDTSEYAAAKKLWSRTSLTPADVDVAGLYDGFSFITLNWLQALGLCGRGEAGPFVQAGNTRPGGRLPVNCDGGATNVGRIHGVNHAVEVVRQLRGQSGPRQKPNARVGVAANANGPFCGCMLFTAD